MIKRKHLSAMLVLCITILVSIVSVGICAPTSETDPKEIVAKAYENFADLQNYHMMIDTTASMVFQGKNIDVIVQGDCDVQTKPMLYKSSMTATVKLDSNKMEQKIVQYMKQDGDQLIVYSNMDNQWVKQVMPFYNPQLLKYDYRKEISIVVPIKNTDDFTVYEVTIEGKCLEETFKKGMTLAGLPKINLFADILKDVGDFKYKVTVDKKNAVISGFDADLSGMMSNIGNNVVQMPGVTEQQKTLLKEIFNNIKIAVTINCSQFNKTGNIIIPQEALNAPLQQTISLTKTENIGFVDTRKIMQESNVAQEHQNTLNQMGHELSSQLEEDKYNLTEEEFQQRQQEAYQEFIIAKQDLEKEIEAEMKEAVSLVATEKKLKSVIYKHSDKDYIPLGGVDITADVMDKMH